MKTIMIKKNIILSIIVSLIFPISIVIGELIGTIIGEILYFIYRYIMFLNISDWMTVIGVKGVQGAIAGFIAGFVNVFVYKSFHFKSTIILPTILLSCAVLGSIIVMINKGEYFNKLTDIMSLLISGYIYLTYLKDNRKGV